MCYNALFGTVASKKESEMAVENEVTKVIEEIEDYLIPFLRLDSYERSLYYHLFRHTRLVGKAKTVFVISSAPKTVRLSEWAARNKLRTMDKKGCIKIVEVRRDGLEISVLLPNEIEGCVVEKGEEVESVDIEAINFYSDPNYRETILKRENGECLYCRRKITKDNYVLDHLIPKLKGGDDSYRNIVAVCYECNSIKSGENANDFVRDLYRRCVLNQKELEQRLNAIESIRTGQLRPEIG